MTGRRMVGIVGAGSALPDTEMSTEANDMSQGYDINPGSASGRQTLNGATDGGSINVAMPSDLQGPNGFNMARADEAAQNTVTNINDAGMDKPSPKFGAFDAPLTGSGPSKGSSATSKDGLNDLGNDAQGSKPSY